MKANSLLIMFLWLFNTSCIASELTENSVRKVISTVVNSVKNRDIQGIDYSFSDDAKILSNVDLLGKKEFYKKTKQEYLKEIEEGWKIYTRYEYSVSNIVIKIQNNKALVTSDVKTSAALNDRALIANSRDCK